MKCWCMSLAKLLYHNNSHCHIILSLNKYLAKKRITQVPPPFILLHMIFSVPKNQKPTPGALFGCFKYIVMENILQRIVMDQLKTLTVNTSSSVTISGINVSPSVWLPKETTWKGIKLFCSYCVINSVYTISLSTF